MTCLYFLDKFIYIFSTWKKQLHLMFENLFGKPVLKDKSVFVFDASLNRKDTSIIFSVGGWYS